MEYEQRKIMFSGVIRSVQPCSNVWRYRLDNRTHSFIGYNLFLAGTADDQEGTFSIAISEKQQDKYSFRIGDEIKGTAWTKKYPKWEYADYYRAGSLKKLFESDVGEFTSVAQANGGLENMINPNCKDKDLLALIKYIAIDLMSFYASVECAEQRLDPMTTKQESLRLFKR